MKRSIYNSTWAFFAFLLLSLHALIAQDRGNEISKTISEKYDVKSSDKLEITNKYGEVTINTWDKNQITVDITVRAWGRSDRDAQQMLDRISIDKDRFDGRIFFKTQVSSGNININKRSGFEINYLVNMPESNPLDLVNKYGAVYLDDFSGSLDLVVGYGKLKAKRIMGERSEVSVSYGSAEIDEFRDGRMTSKYSKPIWIEKADNLDVNDKYGGFEIGEAGSIDCRSAYSSLSIEVLSESLFLESKYGSGNIRKVEAGFEEIDVETSYGSFTASFDNNASFDFDIETRYGSFSHNMGLEIRRQIEKSFTSKEYSGYYGSQGKSRVKVSSSYGSVKFR